MEEYILVRSDRDLALVYEFFSYEEHKKTIKLEYKGVVYCGLKLSKKTARDRAIMIGWKEITTEYKEWIESKNKEVEPQKEKKKVVRKKTKSKTKPKK